MILCAEHMPDQKVQTNEVGTNKILLVNSPMPVEASEACSLGNSSIFLKSEKRILLLATEL